MKTCYKIIALGLVLGAAASCSSVPPLVYEVENTQAAYKAPEMNPDGLTTPQESLPNPLAWASGKGEVKNIKEWSKRRAEISAMIQYYETGIKPSVAPGDVSARMSGDSLYVDVRVGDQTLSLSTYIIYPETGEGPFPVMIGTSVMSLPRQIFEDKPVAMMIFHERQVTNYGQWGPHASRGSYEFDRLYPELRENGAYIEWAWGLSRIIDGLCQLGPEKTRIDTRHIGVTGCSYAGKMALFCGAFDERVALTIAQEPGGGGAAAWRVSHTLEGVEDLEHTDYNWFKESFRDTFSGERVSNIPYDRHELCAMVCPRALLILGNTDYQWLADESGYVSANAARKVWERFGIADRMGWSIEGGHPHCMLPESQYPEVEAFVDRFLLGKDDVNTVVMKAPMFEDVDLDRWIKY